MCLVVFDREIVACLRMQGCRVIDARCVEFVRVWVDVQVLQCLHHADNARRSHTIGNMPESGAYQRNMRFGYGSNLGR